MDETSLKVTQQIDRIAQSIESRLRLRFRLNPLPSLFFPRFFGRSITGSNLIPTEPNTRRKDCATEQTSLRDST